MILNRYFYDFELYQSPTEIIPENNLSGDNEKKLLVVIKKDDYSVENKDFLSKILGAVHFKMDTDCKVLIIPQDQFYSVNSMLRNDDFDRCIIFGLNPKDLGFSIETFLYSPFEIASKNYLIGHDLEKIKSTTNFKKSLWTALQSLFSI